jgi:tryptophan synthase alpha subunit
MANTWITQHQTLSGGLAEVLELGHPGAKPIRMGLLIQRGTRALVRREYYELLELIKDRSQASPRSSNGLIVLGQPGIGGSC